MNAELLPYVKLVEFLGRVLGSSFEVVLHDTEDLNNSIVAIANNSVSKRIVGGPGTNLIIDILKNPEYRQKDFFCNYTGVTSSKTTLKSSTFLIRSKESKIIGMLCINIECENLFKARDVLDSILQIKGSVNENGISENLSLTVDELTLESIKKVVDKFGICSERMSQAEKMGIVDELFKAGIFNLKGAVAQTSAILKISEPTVYRYLNCSKRKMPVNK